MLTLFPSESPTTSPESSDVDEIVDLPDVVKRRRMPIAQIAPEDEKLRHAHAYWTSKRKGGLLPARRDIDILELRPLLGTMHLVDVVDGDPANFRFRVYGSSIPLDSSHNYTNSAIGDYPSPAYRRSLMEDYGAVAFTGTPNYQHIVALINYLPHSYSRLILPLADDGRRVDVLWTCVQMRQFQDLSL